MNIESDGAMGVFWPLS